MEDADRVPLPPGDDDFDRPPMPAGAQPRAQQQFFGHPGFIPPQQPNQWFQYAPWMAQPAVQPHPAHPAKVKLPAFWAKDVASWYELVESTFDRLHVYGSLLRYEFVLMAVPEDVLEKLRSVLRVARTSPDPYRLLKDRLIELHTPSVMELMNSIIWQPELGGRRPSELMEAMLALLPVGEQPGLLFKAHFIHKLPADMKDRVALEVQRLEPRALAALADQLYHVRNTGQPVATVAAVATQETSPDELVAAISKMHFKNRKQQNKKKQANSDGRKLCTAHRRYGDNAYGCLDTASCEWQKKQGN